MASKQLPGVIDLLQDSWRFFVSKWNKSLKITVWLIYISLIQFALLLLFRTSPFFSLIFIPAEIGVFVLTLWVGVRIIQVLLQLEAGKKPSYSAETLKEAWRLIPSLLWIAVLTVLIVFGGTLLFILPGIYLAIILSFSNFYLLEEHVRGTAALAKSRELIKGRFWATLWRMLAGGFVFFIGLTLIMGVLVSLITLMAGPEHIIAVNRAGLYELQPLAQGTIDLLQSLVLAALLPFILGYQIKLYRALRRTA